MTSPQLTPRRVSIANLLLDPNNPRFVEDLAKVGLVSDSEVEGLQSALRKRFRPKNQRRVAADTSEDDTEEFFQIDLLVKSMHEIGVVLVDRIVVRPLEGSSDKFVVIEGNRRIASAKYLIDEDQRAPESKKLSVNHPDRYHTLTEIEVLVLNWNDLSPAVRSSYVSVILGLRHFGGVKEWGKHAKAFNIYTEYMGSEPPLKEFKWDPKRQKEVAARLSVDRGTIKKSLRTLRAFRELEDADYSVKSHHFHLIENLVNTKKLQSNGYIALDDNTFELDGPSLERLAGVGQFDIRDTLKGDARDEQIILKDEKRVRDLANIVAAVHGDADEGVQKMAQHLLGELEDGGRTLQSAKDELIAFRKKRKWVDELQNLLERREEHLPLADFEASGNARASLETTKKNMVNLRAIMRID